MLWFRIIQYERTTRPLLLFIDVYKIEMIWPGRWGFRFSSGRSPFVPEEQPEQLTSETLW